MDTPPANEITRDQPPQPRQQDDNNTDITNDSFSSEPPIWASSSSETPADNLAPPPTYDPSAYSAPLNGTPAFKPRKSNRVSALAYSSDGTPPESQSGVPPGRSGSPALPPLPAGGPPGMKLPPPPMRTTETAAAPAPYAQDFRTAEIVNHWNDPPTQIFAKKAQDKEDTAYDFGPIKDMLTAVVTQCSEYSKKLPMPQQRMLTDATNRLSVLYDHLDKGTLKERIIKPVDDMVKALSLRSFAECQAIHTKLMQTEFESEGKWLLGFKRLVDVYTSVPSS